MPAGRHSPPREERLWIARLRWRLRGATQAPLFVVLVALEGLLLSRLPVTGVEGADLIGAILLAGFVNIVIVAIVAPLVVLGRRHRRARGGATGTAAPVHVERDRAGSAIMLAVAVGLLVAGVVHRSDVSAAREDHARGLQAARTWIVNQRPDLHPMIGAESVWKAGDHFYRTCVPRGEPDRSLCLYVDTSESVPTVRLDRDQQSNARIAGPENPAALGQ